MTGWRMSEHGVPDSRLTIICRSEDYFQPDGTKISMWKCKCDCENEVVVRGTVLRNGEVRSCGCLLTSVLKKRALKFRNTYDLSGTYGVGYTNKGEKFYFDIEDFDKIKQYCWRIDKDGYVVTNLPSSESATRSLIPLHRLVLQAKKDDVVDHIKHNTVDNRKSQLRIVTRSQNSINAQIRSNNKSGITGVYFYPKTQKWTAEIKVNKKKIFLGYFQNMEDAVKARKEAEETYHGEYSYDNSMASKI